MKQASSPSEGGSGGHGDRRPHMRLDLSEILAHVGLRIKHAIDEPAVVEDDLQTVGGLTGQLIFTNTGGLLLVEGGVQATVSLECSRCLVTFAQPMEVVIEEQFAIETRQVGPRSRHTEVTIEEDVNPQAGRLFDGPMFDQTELLRQAISVALPMQPLHSEGCRGLCPVCGSDRNVNECACETEEHNRPFGALRDLLDQPE